MKIKLNDNFLLLKPSYLFSEIAVRVKKYAASHPDAEIIRLGIGDVTLPLGRSVVNAMEKATCEMGVRETFRGYAPEYGYDFLREAISRHYEGYNVSISPDDIFVSDGAKSDVGNLVDILGDNPVYIPNPVYPVYMDANIMSGREIHLMNGNRENGFLPMPTDAMKEGAVIYICSPNNPTGAVYSFEELRRWVAYALKSGSLIIFDAAYEAFIDGEFPHSIYQIDGADQCAIEICSFSKPAGFTGTRCAWTVVPAALQSDGQSLGALWKRRQATKFNGVSYIVQRGAEAALSMEGKRESQEMIGYYMENAKILSGLLDEKEIFYTGGKSSPYIWLKCPENMTSWDFFDFLLEKAQIVGTPGAGFGDAGEGYFRLTSFGAREDCEKAVKRLEKLL